MVLNINLLGSVRLMVANELLPNIRKLVSDDLVYGWDFSFEKSMVMDAFLPKGWTVLVEHLADELNRSSQKSLVDEKVIQSKGSEMLYL